MKWKYKNGVHDLSFSIEELEKMIKGGGLHTVKTHSQDLIVIHRE